MPKSLRVDLTDDQRRDLHTLLKQRNLTHYTRQRAECARLLDRGRTVTEVAELLECNPVTVRAAVHRFDVRGIAGLPDAVHPGRPAKAFRAGDRAALAELLPLSCHVGWSLPRHARP
ncbi:helix-turn-helix domain-containing protein [Streptomyces hesseae]|uniref:Helix-turn-helix domain-containing protein n=1 Tax=Streptomyces hesseae TaxID=3075519 RepID=A0ABU2SFS4_9ACTN|nr:helix-turn-helix domain-containing protein [Streptomyces sp. DSM 40473]MDT0447778.1 helix-turn-helix domain-containing protein [Streptomyces sp. DSM 40473]